MKFSLFVHMERYDEQTSHRQLFEDLTELTLLAEAGGFSTVWIGEHHAMEYTISPSPMPLLAYLAARTSTIRLGAGTITSNLKNTYGEISVRVGQKEVPTGRRFLGSLIGDHAKTAIGTRLMTGSYIGFSSMIAISAHAPRFVPSFSYCTDRGVERYQMDKAIEVTRRVYQRRERVWTDTDEQIMQYVAHTAPEVEGGG